MRKIILCLLFCCLLCTVYTQTPGVRWSKHLGGTNNSEFIIDAKHTNGNGFILVGADTSWGGDFSEEGISNKEGRGRPWISKVDALGNIIWERTQPENYHHLSQFTHVLENMNSDFVAVGSTHDFSVNQQQVYIAKFDNPGNLIWQKFYGGTGIDKANSIVQTNDGGYIVAGLTNSNDGDVTGNHSAGFADVWLIKLNEAGNISWKKCFGGSNHDTAYSVIQTPDKGFLIAGSSRSSNGDLTGNNGETDAWLFKTDSLGNLMWQKNYGGVGSEAFKSAVVNSDGSFTLTGYTSTTIIYTNTNHGKKDLWVVNIDMDGTVVWSQMFGGEEDEQGLSINHTLGNGYLISGYTKSNNGDISGNNGLADAWLLKLTSGGKLIWQKCIGTAKNEYASASLYLSENDYAIAGAAQELSTNQHDGYLVQLGNTNTIKGTLFLDINSNGAKDANEENFDQQVIIKSEKTGYERSVLTINGSFITSVDTGIFATSAQPVSIYYNLMPSSVTSSFSSYFNTDSISFAIQPIPNKQDLVINAVPLTAARPGFNTTYKLYYKNVGTTTIAAGEILFKKDSRLTLLSSLPAMSSGNGDTLKWSYTNLAPADTGSITLQLRIQAPPTVNNGDTLTSVAIITPVAADETPADDTGFVKHLVTGSFDPNDKYENNGGIIRPEHITNGDFLNYTIRFQNTGTDTAFTVVVRDTLDAKVETGTLQMISTSHNYDLSIEDGDKLIWTFTNINLPDSNINEPASHGFIAYRIKPKATVALGDTVHNTASIYFDFNLPVLTNNAFATVQNNIILPLKLLSFSGYHDNGVANLNWRTQGELDFEKFVIERSLNGREFVIVGNRFSNGNRSSITNYQFSDNLQNLQNEVFLLQVKDDR